MLSLHGGEYLRGSQLDVLDNGIQSFVVPSKHSLISVHVLPVVSHISMYSFYKHILGVPVVYQDIEAVDPDFFRSLKYIVENNIGTNVYGGKSTETWTQKLF